MLLGYVEFIVLLFLPGAAFIEIFQLGGELSLAERLGLAFGLSMAVDVIVLAFRTSGLLVGSQLMVGIFPLTLEIMLGVSLAAFAGAIGLRRKTEFYVRPTRNDLYVLGLVAAQALLIIAHFSKYPIFPEYQSADFLQHVQITRDLEMGGATMFPGGILYYGAHLLMGSLGALSGDLLLVVTQYAMGILTALSPLLLFSAVASVTESRRVGLIATLLYVATGFVWFGSVFNAGLYANFYGILSILLVFTLVPAVLRAPRSWGTWLALAVALGNGYLSHYSFVTILPSLIALPLAVIVLERRISWPHVAIPAVAIAPAAVVLALKPDLLGLMLQFLQGGGGSITGDTFLSGFLSGVPVLRYILIEVTNDVASVLVLALAAVGAYFTVRGRRPLAWMMVIWLIALLVVAPVSEAAWRFSYMALLPLLVIASFAVERMIPEPKAQAVKRSKMRARTDTRRYRVGLLAVLFLLLVVNSWSWVLVADASTNGGATNEDQHAILQSMQWMDSNLPKGSDVVSVTSFDYSYFYLLFPGREAGYAPLVPPDEIASASSGSSVPTYVVLTKIATFSGTPPSTSNPFNLYPSDSRFHLVYNKTGVLIYQLG